MGFGGDKRDKVKLAVLSLVIVGALAGLVLSWNNIANRSAIDERPDSRYRCTKCGHEWSMNNHEVRMAKGPSLDPRMDCPECKGVNAATLVKTCPYKDCGKDYLQTVEGVRTCPECGGDIGEWYRSHPLK